LSQERDIEIIDQFLQGELSDVERIQFDQRRSDDEVFNDLVLDVLAIQRAARESELKKTLLHFQKIEEESGGKVFQINRWMAAAAALLFMVVAVYGWQHWQERSRINGIMASYEHVMSDVLTRGNYDVNERKKAYVLYEARRYEQAIQLFENILDQERRSDSIFYGLNLLHAREFDRAEEVLRGISEGEEQELIIKGLEIINEIKR